MKNVCIMLLFMIIISGCVNTVVMSPLPPIERQPYSVVVLCRKNNFYGAAAPRIYFLDGKPLFRSGAGKYTRFRILPGKHAIRMLGDTAAGIYMVEKEFIAEQGGNYYFSSNFSELEMVSEQDLKECFDDKESYEFIKVQ